MKNRAEFNQDIHTSYSHQGRSIVLGTAVLDGEVVTDATISIPLKTLNRHGLIAGATGTGKTVTLQLFAEELCKAGIPVLMMDMKGDLSGIAAGGKKTAEALSRIAPSDAPFEPAAITASFLTLTNSPGIRLRATVSEFGPVLFSKILGLNDTQAGVVSALFAYADDEQLPLLDLKDFSSLLQFASAKGKEAIATKYGTLPAASLGTIQRKLLELGQQGGDQFFGEPSFDVNDLLRTDDRGWGIASVVRLQDMQDRPKLFSTFMLCLLAEIYQRFPEAGDPDKPKLCIFIDEAHLVFKDASAALLDQVETIVKLIRSKGIGIFFITQSPNDIADPVLAQLGLRIQHALRAFTEKDRKAIRKTAENYPTTPFYKIDALLTTMGIGEALVTALDEKGRPTTPAHTRLKTPTSRIGTLSSDELETLVQQDEITEKYNNAVDRESAYEILRERLATTAECPSGRANQSREKSALEKAAANPLVREAGRTMIRELTRGLLGVLGLAPGRRRRYR